MGLGGYIARINKRTGRNIVHELIIGIIALIIFFILWKVLSEALDLAYLPPPEDVARAFVDSFQSRDPNLGITMWTNIESSLRRFIMGFAIALALAIPVGLAIGSSKTAEAAAKPLIEIFRPLPPIAWVPFLFIVLGYIWGPITVIVLGVFFPVLSNVIFGVKNVEPQLIDAAKTLGASRLTIFTKVIFPYTVPYIMAGITIGLGIGWMCIVAAEMIGTRSGGVGLFILTQASVGRWDFMFAGMAVIALLGLITVEGAAILERRISKIMGVAHK